MKKTWGLLTCCIYEVKNFLIQKYVYSVKRGAEVNRSADFWCMHVHKSRPTGTSQQPSWKRAKHEEGTRSKKSGQHSSMTVSSMDRIRRLLEIEEMRSFSEKLNI